jgi:hypothetical protein
MPAGRMGMGAEAAGWAFSAMVVVIARALHSRCNWEVCESGRRVARVLCASLAVHGGPWLYSGDAKGREDRQRERAKQTGEMHGAGLHLRQHPRKEARADMYTRHRHGDDGEVQSPGVGVGCPFDAWYTVRGRGQTASSVVVGCTRRPQTDVCCAMLRTNG